MMKVVSKVVKEPVEGGGSRLRLKFYLDCEASYVHRCDGCENHCKIDAVVLRDGAVIPKASLVERVETKLHNFGVSVSVAENCLFEIVLEPEIVNAKVMEVAERAAKAAKDEIDVIVSVLKELEAVSGVTLLSPRHHK